MSHEEAMDVILKGDGRTSISHFDPTVLEAFKTLHEDFDGVFTDFSASIFQMSRRGKTVDGLPCSRPLFRIQ